MRNKADNPARAADVPLRPPDQVMRLSRMGAFHPTRLSFVRSLIRRLSKELVNVVLMRWDMDSNGYGTALYSLDLEGRTYSLCAFSRHLNPSQRSDRVIAEAWDTTFALYDGVPNSRELARLEANLVRQEGGRYLPSEIVISRANKSTRLFDHVVQCLAEGRQPDTDQIVGVGYLMRTTAVYGNGKFGIADRDRIKHLAAFRGPFQAELLTVWLIRGFTHDLVEHIARARSPGCFVPLADDLKRHLGIGNATGLGMAPFLVSHPILLNNWMVVRETALSRVRSIGTATTETVWRFPSVVGKAIRHLAEWNVDDELQMRRINETRRELAQLNRVATERWLKEPYPWNRFFALSSDMSAETQELAVALVLEVHGTLVDELTDAMSSETEPRLDPAMKLDELREIVASRYSWAKRTDFSDPGAVKHFWYVSEEKLEPRRGNRDEEEGSELELRVDVGRQLDSLASTLENVDGSQSVAEFLIARPDLRHVTRRVQTARSCPYSEIQDNLIGSDCRPIDILRCKLSIFGATKFDPKSDLWTRITLFQGAPCFDSINDRDADDWSFPSLEVGH